MLVAYNERESLLIDYFLIDYCIYLAYTEFPAVQKMIDAIPYNNENWSYLISHIGQKPTEEELASVFRSTQVFKMSYKCDYSRLQGDDLLYHRLLRGEI